MITNPRLAVLYVSDQDRTLRFLTGALGFELVLDVPHGADRRWVEVRPAGAQTCVVLAAIEPADLARLRAQTGRMSHGWFDCDDLDATCAQLRARGVEIVTEPQATPWRAGGRWAQIADHDGNLYGLTEPLGRPGPGPDPGPSVGPVRGRAGEHALGRSGPPERPGQTPGEGEKTVP